MTKIQKELALKLMEIGGIQFDFKKGFRLVLHDVHPEAPLSPFYINLRRIRSFPEIMNLTVECLAKIVLRLDFDYIADVPTAATPIGAVLANKLRVPQITPRMDKKSHGLSTKIDGFFQKGKRAVLIDDLVTRADSKLEAIETLKANGLVVKDIVVVFDREQGGAKRLAEEGYTLHAVFKIKPTLRFYARTGKITREQLTCVLEYLAAPLGKRTVSLV